MDYISRILPFIKNIPNFWGKTNGVPLRTLSYLKLLIILNLIF